MPTKKSAAKAPETVDGYLAALPAGQRAALTKVRRLIRAAAPKVVESIGYGMPTFKLDGKPLIAFAAWRSHCAIYGSTHGLPLGYRSFVTSKGTISFSPDKPLPATLVTKLVKSRVASIGAAGDAKAYGDRGARPA